MAAFNQNTLSWIGHGEIGTSSYLYLETVKQELDGTFSHQSLMLVDIADLASKFGLNSALPALPTTLIQKSAADWSIVSEIASSHILVI